jgi:hypothetical protein
MAAMALYNSAVLRLVNVAAGIIVIHPGRYVHNSTVMFFFPFFSGDGVSGCVHAERQQPTTIPVSLHGNGHYNIPRGLQVRGILSCNSRGLTRSFFSCFEKFYSNQFGFRIGRGHILKLTMGAVRDVRRQHIAGAGILLRHQFSESRDIRWLSISRVAN